MNTPAFSSSKAAHKEAAPYHVAVVGGGIAPNTMAAFIRDHIDFRSSTL
jgi:hypothetical protein